MVQELIDRLAEVESRQMFLKEQLRQAINAAKCAMDMVQDADMEIYNMRQEIEFQVINN